MQIRNNYQIEWEVLGHYNLPLDKGVGVFNGDMGVVREINHFAEQLVVEFDEGRRVTYGLSLIHIFSVCDLLPGRADPVI